MAKQKAKPVGKKAVDVKSSGKPKTSKATAVTIVKDPAMKKPLAKSAVKPAKAATAPPKKSTASVVTKAASPPAKKKTPATKSVDKMPNSPATRKMLVQPSLEERYRMVELAAYFIAEQHGFEGSTDEYWAAAENEIAARLGI